MSTESETLDVLTITPAMGVVAVSAKEAAIERRNDLLTQARAITSVADRFDADCAIAVQRDLKAFADGIEAARVLAKEPYLTTGRDIDALAKELKAEIENEGKRVSRLVGAFELAERNRAEDERRKAEAEAARIAAEASRAAAEAAAKERTLEAKERAADNVFAVAQTKIVEVRQAAANAVPSRPSGVSVRQYPKYEVTDIRALYAAHPDYCNIEPNGSVIIGIMRQNPNIKIPGVRTWWEAGASV